MPIQTQNSLEDSFVLGSGYQPPPESAAPGWGETFGAGFRMENDLYNMYHLFQPVSPPDPNFDLAAALHNSPYRDTHATAFVGVQNQVDFNKVERDITRQLQDRKTLASAGWAGVVAGMAAGVVSPTIFLPIAGAARGAAGAASAFGYAALGGLAQEGTLLAAQDTRTMGEAGIGIATQTVLGGLLGSAVAYLRPGELDAIAHGMDDAPGAVTILPAEPIGTGPTVRSAGAAEAKSPFEGAGRLRGASGGAVESRLVSTLGETAGPVTRVINSGPEHSVASAEMAKLSDAGAKLEGYGEGRVAREGGTVQSNITTYEWLKASAIEANNKAYNDFVLGGKAFARTRSAIINMIPGGPRWAGIMGHDEWNRRISDAIEQVKGREIIPEIEAAAQQVKKDLFDEVGRLAVESGVFKGVEDLNQLTVKGALGYLHRIYNVRKIESNQTQWLAMWQAHFKDKLTNQFKTRFEKLTKKNKLTEQDMQDLARPRTEAEAMIEDIKKQLEQADNSNPIQAQEDALAAARTAYREGLKSGADNLDELKAALDTAKQELKSIGADAEQFRTDRGALRRRLRVLRRGRGNLERRQQEALDKIDSIEEQNINAYKRAARSINKVMRDLDRISPERLDAELAKLETQLRSIGEAYDKGEERIVKLAKERDVQAQAAIDTPTTQGPDFSSAEAKHAQVEAAQRAQKVRASRLQRVAQKLDDIEHTDHEAVRQALNEGLDDTLRKINAVNNRRALREAKLREKAQALDPARAAQENEALKMAMEGRNQLFLDQMRKAGVSDYNLETGSFDFSAAAMDAAHALTEKILKHDRTRLVGVDMRLGEERNAMLARMLDMPIETPGFRDYLERDINRVILAYTRTMAPDIEMFRATGSVNGAKALEKMKAEYDMRRAQITEDRGWDGQKLAKPRTTAEKDKLLENLGKKFMQNKIDYETVVARLRHQRGIPQSAAGLGYRMGELALNINTYRMMGSVLPSSLQDVARPVMKMGLMRTFRDGWVPFVTNLKQLKRSKQLARFSGTANDAFTHSRAQSVLDILDEYRHGNPLEKGASFLAHRTGIVALFDYWTQGMKYISFGPTNAMLWDAIEHKMTGSTKNISKKVAQEFLDEYGITDRLAAKMWNAVNAEGGGIRGNRGVWLPNAENWTDQEAKRAYQTAINKAIDDTIITPGPERPSWVDANMGAKLIAQFRSFAFSSTTKMMLSGIQQRDMALVNGTILSLALGGLSYYIWAVTTGGKAYEEMMNAGPDRWADEAIDRSGLLAVLGEGRRIGERVPLLNQVMTFSGQRTSRRAGEDLVSAILGPSYDLAQRESNIITQIDSPTASTIHNIRLLTPFQNVFWARRGFDAVEKGFNERFGIPEKRQ